jgi:hypothetical protein
MAEASSGTRLTCEQCEAKAKECRDLARRTPKAEYRTMLEQMAQTWDRVVSTFTDRQKLH